MNILHVNSTDLVGGRFTGYYMQQALKKNHTVEMAVWNRTKDNLNVYSMKPGNWFRFPYIIIRKFEDKLGLEGLTGLAGWTLSNKDYFKRADIVHLHLIHDGPYFSPLSLPTLSRKKTLVWTIHDTWSFTGGCVYPFDCDRWLTGCAPRCPYPRRKSLFQHYMPALHWQLKKRVYQRSDITLVVASKWMHDRVKKSPLMQHLSCRLIPFGIDIETFRPYPKAEARKKLGIWPDQKVIVFRDVGIHGDRFKGMRYILDALMLYEPQEPTCLIILDNGRTFHSLWPKYNVNTLGWIDGEELAIALSAGDIFLMPSVQEAFGLMAVESMACGTPVVVFEGTALPDVIKSPQGGLTVPARDSVELAGAIMKLLTDDDLRERLGKQARQIVEKEYALSLYVQRHISLYEELIENKRHS
ncbi:MAG: glycosyltransferase [Anaerolineaceae bacterium]|nr:glycosyltransferase [Anaerolineaceae bacterium]